MSFSDPAGKQAVANTSTLVLAANGQRRGLILKNTDASIDISISIGQSTSDAGADEGIHLAAGAGIVIDSQNGFGDATIKGAVYAIADSGTPNLAWHELF